MSRRPPLALGVLASGTGSNFEAIAKACEAGTLRAEIRVVVCNRADALVLAKAAAHGIPTVVLSHRDYPQREAFDEAIAAVLDRHDVELVVMAGFDRVVTGALLVKFPQRVINIHPSLLPAFKGLDAQRQAFEYGARIAGATVHLVDEHVDHGPIIAQVAVPVLPGDDAETLRRRILAHEHVIFPYAIQLFADERVRVDGRRVEILGTPSDALASGLFSPKPQASDDEPS